MRIELIDVEVHRDEPGVAVVRCSGEHDVVTKNELGSLLSDLVTAHELVVIDVTDARFVDSSFIHNVFGAARLARERGSQLRLRYGAELIVRRALEVSGVLAHIELTAEVDGLGSVDPCVAEPDARQASTAARPSATL